MYPLPALKKAGDTAAETTETTENTASPVTTTMCSACPSSMSPLPVSWFNTMDVQSWLLIIVIVLLGLLLLLLKIVWETKARLDLYLHLGWQKQAVLGSGP